MSHRKLDPFRIRLAWNRGAFAKHDIHLPRKALRHDEVDSCLELVGHRSDLATAQANLLEHLLDPRKWVRLMIVISEIAVPQSDRLLSDLIARVLGKRKIDQATHARAHIAQDLGRGMRRAANFLKDAIRKKRKIFDRVKKGPIQIEDEGIKAAFAHKMLLYQFAPMQSLHTTARSFSHMISDVGIEERLEKLLFSIWRSNEEIETAEAMDKSSYNLHQATRTSAAFALLAALSFCVIDAISFGGSSLDAPSFLNGDVMFQRAGLLVGVSALTALVEELVFRGIVLSFLLRHMSKASALWLSALAFALVHGLPIGISTSTLITLLPFVFASLALKVMQALLFGVLMGRIILEEGSLLSVIAIHGAFDIIYFAPSVLIMGDFPATYAQLSPAELLGTCLSVIILAVPVVAPSMQRSRASRNEQL